MNRPISPPPTKRQKLSPKPQTQPHPSPPIPPPDPTILRVYSWNINGITPFLPQHQTQNQNQNRITNFFKSKTSSPSNSNPTSTTRSNPASLREFLRHHNWPQILCLQEVKIAKADLKTQNLVRAAVNTSPVPEEKDNGPKYKVHFTLPTDKYTARGPGNNGKFYGVCSILRSDFYSHHVTCVKDVEWDREGRISIIEMEFQYPLSVLNETGTEKQVKKLAIWNIYAVNGTTNPWRSSKTGRVLGTRHDKKLDVHKRIMEDCLSMQQSAYEILLIGDINIAPQRIDGHPKLRTWPEQHSLNRADFNDKFLSPSSSLTSSNQCPPLIPTSKQPNKITFPGIDIYRHTHPTTKKYTYHPRTTPWGTTCDRVDLAIASASLVKEGAIVDCEIWDSEVERGPSDHCPISVDIRLGVKALAL